MTQRNLVDEETKTKIAMQSDKIKSKINKMILIHIFRSVVITADGTRHVHSGAMIECIRWSQTGSSGYYSNRHA